MVIRLGFSNFFSSPLMHKWKRRIRRKLQKVDEQLITMPKGFITFWKCFGIIVK